MKQISILGTGWLGFPLSKKLITDGYTIHGSTTSASKLALLNEEGINPFVIKLTEEGVEGDVTSFLRDSKLLLINIPPGLRRNPDSNFVLKIKTLLPYIKQSSVEQLLFISSTSVFADQIGFPVITDKTLPNATSKSGEQLIKVEKLLLENLDIDTTIIRFAGLFDARRHPAMMLSKRKNIKNPKAPVNLIHRQDCVGIIEKIIETDNWGISINVAYPDHPEKAHYYTKICEQMGLSTPDYENTTPSQGKIIVTTTDYVFKNDLYTSS